MSYHTLAGQASMAFDARRNAWYAAAIRRRVTPRSVVLDLGAGLGILGLIAAAAGARKVYLVEPEPVVRLARRIAADNGLAERVEILEGRIEEVVLPEPVDWILSVCTGNLLFSEDLLGSLYHARDRYLKPGGGVLPERAQLLARAVSAPHLHGRLFERWLEPQEGIDFGAGRRFAVHEIQWPERDALRQTEPLAPAAVLVDLDLGATRLTDCQGAARVRVTRGGACHGLVLWIELFAGDAPPLSSSPWEPAVHWSPAFLPLDPPLPLAPGDELRLSLHRPAGGDWTWTAQAPAGSRRHSTFLARLDGRDRYARAAEGARPELNPRGHALRDALAAFAAGLSVAEVAERLARTYPAQFADRRAALEAVQSWAIRYGKKPGAA